MTIQGKHFFKAAEFCLEDSEESSHRSAISRAYYALYHETCSILEHCPPFNHDGVVQYLLHDSRRNKERHEILSLTQIGAVLLQQKIKRKRADYELNENVSFDEAKSSLAAVDKILSKIQSMR